MPDCKYRDDTGMRVCMKCYSEGCIEQQIEIKCLMCSGSGAYCSDCKGNGMVWSKPKKVKRGRCEGSKVQSCEFC